MNDDAKITLSALEAMLVNNTEWILTKHTVMQKAGDLLAAQVPAINRSFIDQLPVALAELSACKPRVFKGERYRDLPYVILDYPAVFSKTDVFALRTMFWWGNFISVTLHLSGKYKKLCEPALQENLHKAALPFYISTGKEEWEHHFGDDNYCKASLLNEELLYKKIVRPSFLKIALQYDLSQWDDMNRLLPVAYSNFAAMLNR